MHCSLSTPEVSSLLPPRQGVFIMDLFRRASRMVPSTQPLRLPTLDGEKRGSPKRKGFASRLAFFRRPLRLRGNSTVSVPLGVVVIFPLLVVILILVLFVRHPSSPGRILMPAGAPPAIRFVTTHASLAHLQSLTQFCIQED